jgi:hypothetical protein
MPIIKPPTVEVSTAIGKLSCEAVNFSEYPGLTVYWGGRQIAVIEPQGDGIRVLVWQTDDDDPDHVIDCRPGYGEQ